MKHVLLALNWYDRLLHEGVADYAAEHGWHLDSSLLRLPKGTPRGWRGDGVITLPMSDRGEMETFIAELDLPTVQVMRQISTVSYPLVVSDIGATAEMAFCYFRERKGFQHFGFYGSANSLRNQAFKACVEQHGFNCQQLVPDGSWNHELEQVKNWLTASPQPMAVYCNNDDAAARLIHIALSLGIQVPHALSVLGTDNTPLVCKCSVVPLSSVDTNLHTVGYEAAALLDRMMTTKGAIPEEPLQIPPKGVVERASTDTLAAASPHARKAIAIMRKDFGRGITIADIVAEVGISHDGLKKAFHRDFGLPPSALLREIRMKEAANQLLMSKEKIRTICRMVGMGNDKHFSHAFKKHFGVSPRVYRLENSRG